MPRCFHPLLAGSATPPTIETPLRRLEIYFNSGGPNDHTFGTLFHIQFLYAASARFSDTSVGTGGEKGGSNWALDPRALIGGTAHGWVIARVEDARIYNTVLDEKEINNLVANTLDVEARGKLATVWGMLKVSK